MLNVLVCIIIGIFSAHWQLTCVDCSQLRLLIDHWQFYAVSVAVVLMCAYKIMKTEAPE
jgi:hypothetical protein